MLDVSTADSITRIRLARAPVNALDPALLDAIRDAVQAAPAAGARGIVISGGPSVFSAGLDVPHLLQLDRKAVTAAWTGFFETARAIARAPVPVVAAIGGHSPAGGCVLALCCDYRIMPHGPFRIGLNEVEVGLPVPDAIQHLLRRVVGAYRAERLLVSGAMVESEHALAIGLVDELTDIDHVDARASAWLAELLSKPSAAMLETRRLARRDMLDALDDPVRIGLDAFADAWFASETQAVLHALVARLKGGKPA